MRKRAKLVVSAVILGVLAVGVPIVTAESASAMSCAGLADRMFSSHHHAVYWAKRYYMAGC